MQDFWYEISCFEVDIVGDFAIDFVVDFEVDIMVDFVGDFGDELVVD